MLIAIIETLYATVSVLAYSEKEDDSKYVLKVHMYIGDD